MCQSVGLELAAGAADFDGAALAAEPDGACAPIVPSAGPEACGNTATTLPLATIFFSSRHSSICCASRTDCPCHSRARPTYVAWPEVFEPVSDSAETCPGPEPIFISAFCDPARYVETTPPVA